MNTLHAHKEVSRTDACTSPLKVQSTCHKRSTRSHCPYISSSLLNHSLASTARCRKIHANTRHAVQSSATQVANRPYPYHNCCNVPCVMIHLTPLLHKHTVVNVLNELHHAPLATGLERKLTGLLRSPLQKEPTTHSVYTLCTKPGSTAREGRQGNCFVTTLAAKPGKPTLPSTSHLAQAVEHPTQMQPMAYTTLCAKATQACSAGTNTPQLADERSPQCPSTADALAPRQASPHTTAAARRVPGAALARTTRTRQSQNTMVRDCQPRCPHASPGHGAQRRACGQAHLQAWPTVSRAASHTRHARDRKAPSAHTTPCPTTGHRPARPHRAQNHPSDLETTPHADRKEVERSNFFIRIAVTPRTPRPSAAPVWSFVDTYTAHHSMALTLRKRRWSAQTGDHARHGSAFFSVTSTKSDMRAGDLVLFLRTLS